MADYGVNIKVAVQNTQKIQDLSNQLKRTGAAVDQQNTKLAQMAGKTQEAIANVKNLNAVLAEAQKNFNKAVLGTQSFISASKDLVATNREVTRSLEQRAAALKRIEGGQAVSPTLMGSAARERQSQFKKLEEARRNAIRDENRALGTQLNTQNKILATESRRAQIQMKALERQEEISRTISAGRMRQRQPEIMRQEQLMLGARQYMRPIGPELPRIMQPDRTAQLLTRQSQQRSAILREMNALSSKSVFNKNLEFALVKQLVGADKTRNLLAEKFEKDQKDMISNQQALAAQKERALAAQKKALDAEKKALALQRQQRNEQRRQKIGGALSSGLIGGGFPLLFGQGGAAAAGGAIGGLAGGAIGGGFGFALSIVGTAIGQALEDAENFDRSLNELNATLSTSGTVSSTTAADVRALASELNIAKEEAIELLGTFSGFGDGDIREELARVFEPVGGRKTLDLLAKARLGEKEALAAISGLSEIITLEKAEELQNQLDINGALVTAALLQEAVLEKSREITQESERTVGPIDHLVSGLAMIANAYAGMAYGPALELEPPPTAEDLAEQRAAGVAPPDQGLVETALAGYEKYLQRRQQLDKKYSVTGTEADPTINLQKRLGVLNKQIASEQKFVGVSSEGESIIKRKLALESKIAQIQETGTAERKRLTDQEDIRLSQSIETQAINLENLKFEREATALIERQSKAGEKLLKPLQKKLDAIRDRNAFEKEYGDLIMSGSTPAAAKQVIEAQKQKKEIDRLVEKQLESNEILIANLRIKVAETEGTKAHAAAVDALNDALERRNKIEEKGRIAKGEIKGEKTPAERFDDEIKAIQGIINELNDPVRQAIELSRTLGSAFSESFKGIVSGSMTAQQALANLFQRTADHFLDMAAQMIAAQLRMQAVKLFMNFFPSVGGGGGGGNGGSGFVIPSDNLTPAANGNAFGRNGLIPFAKGGVVNKPTLFPFANGTGLMGEAGPEAIMPLSRGPNGRLGVEALGAGAGATNIVVNVDASGSSVEGDSDQAAQLGKMLGAAVQAELVKQKRPGGLLAS